MLKKSLLLTLLLALLVPWAANAQKALPYSYGFENNDLNAEGWTVQKTSSSTGISTNAKHEGSYGFQFNYSEQNAYLVSPVLSGTESGVALSFYYKESSNSYGDEQFYVGYTTDETVTDPSSFTYGDITTASLSWELYEVTLPAGTKKVAIKYVYNDALYLYLDDFTFEAPSSCPKPSGLNVALTPGNGTVATLSWTSEATAWQICLNDDETNLIAATTNPFQLTGLTPETTYTAKVRANCGSEQSGWSNEVTFKPTNAYAITVNDGTSTNGYVPIYGYYVDDITKSQFIIPASELTAMAWGTINKMTFYASNASINWGNAQFEVYMTETSETTLSELADYSTMTKVKNAGSLSISDNQMVVELDTPYEYSGGNLMIGFLQTVTGSWSSCSWYGVSATGASMGGNGSSISQQNFLPKTTFDYIPGSAPTCLKPTDLAVSNITATSAILSWTENGTASAWKVAYSENNVDFREVAANSNPFTLTNLNQNREIFVKVQADCGGGDLSSWSSTVSFTTLEACPTPTNLVISDITAFSANVSWSPTDGTFEMRYSVDIDPNNDFESSSLKDWTNIDADGDGYVWVLSSATDGIYLDGNISPNLGHNSSLDFVTSGSYSNLSGALTPDNYLVSPQITLGGSISFWAQAQDASYPEEHFGVAVSTTGNTDAADFTTIQEWTMSAKSAGTLRSSNGKRGGDRATGNWYQYTVDLSAYSGQGYVAIRHFDCTDNFLLNVDDIVIVQPGFEIPWVNVTNPTNPQVLTNLEPETNYLVQVRANCGSDGYSQWLEGSFTTLPSCMVPTDLVISKIDKRSANLAWTANGAETAWQISLNDGTSEEIIDVTETTYSFNGLTPETRYTVKVRAVCDATLQSNWSSPANFTTLVACPAPTALAISDITNVSAVATWTYDGDVELEYAEDVWKHYDNGVFAGAIGMGTAGSRFAWGSMFPAAMLTSNNLTHVALYELAERNVNDITLIIYQGGETAPETQLYTETFAPMGTDGWHEVTLATPVTIDPSQNLWVVFSGDDAYPAQGCADMGTVNNRWTSLDNGTTWGDLTSYGVSDRSWMIRAAFENNTQTNWVSVNNPATPQALAGLTPETSYMVRLRAVCGGEDGESVWVSTMFTTDVACPAPTALAATPYANSAVLSWEGISESYTVSYREPAVIGGIDEEFATSSAPTGWTMYTGLLSNVMENPSALTSATYGWTFGTGNGVFDSHARCNIYSNYQRWLVTPAIEVPAGAAFSFDMALTAYSGTVAAPATTGTDDKFVVLVSTDNMATWTILRQWDNAGSEYVYNNIANTATGENVSFDFSAYAGQTVYVAFYGESTQSNADNYLHIDNVNVTVAELVPAGEWMTVNTNEATATITGLTPATKYEWKVQGDCGSFGVSLESAISSFTTTNDLCPLPTALAVDTVTATTADLSWNGSPDVASFNVRYRSPEHTEGGLYETFNTNAVPNGWTRYTGLVDDVVAGTATLSSTTSGWIPNSYALGNYNMKLNIYGTSCKTWLVTPEVKPDNGNFTFDLALTAYNSNNAIANDTLQADDRFAVLVYADSTWTILREWNNSGSSYVYNSIGNTAQQVSIDLSSYVGETIKIAFYGESTNLTGVANTSGDNDLHIDNVLIGNLIPASAWELVENITDMNVTLTGLTPETPYEAQVQNVCSPDSIWSNTVTFTTLEQTTITQTISLTNVGVNFCSFYVDITLADLQTALTDALGTGSSVSIQIKSKTLNCKLTRGRWTGSLTTLDLGMSYKIIVSAPCEITLEGMLVDPAAHPVTVIGQGQATWLAFPFNADMTLTNAFAGFAVNGDIVRSKTQNANYTRGRWTGGFSTLEPGNGYIYKSASNAADRTFTYPVSK